MPAALTLESDGGSQHQRDRQAKHQLCLVLEVQLL